MCLIQLSDRLCVAALKAPLWLVAPWVVSVVRGSSESLPIVKASSEFWSTQSDLTGSAKSNGRYFRWVDWKPSGALVGLVQAF